jgi:hypothetical protein
MNGQFSEVTLYLVNIKRYHFLLVDMQFKLILCCLSFQGMFQGQQFKQHQLLRYLVSVVYDMLLFALCNVSPLPFRILKKTLSFRAF